MKWKLSIPKPPILVYYYVKFMGLAPFTVKNNKFYPPTVLSVLYPVLVTAVYFIVASKRSLFMLESLWESDASKFGKIMVAIETCTSYSTTFITLLIFLCMYNKILCILNKMCDIGKAFKRLDIEEDQEKIFNNIFVTVIFTNAIVVLIFATMGLLETNWPIDYSIYQDFNTWFHINTILIFAKTLSFIKQRFKLINNKLYDVFRTAGNSRSLHCSRVFAICRNPCDETQTNIENLTDLERIQIIEGLQLDLCDMVDELTRLFVIPIIWKSLQFCTSLILICFWIFFIVQNLGQDFSDAEIGPAMRTVLCSLLRIFLLIVQIFLVGHASSKTCQEGNFTEAVLCKARYKFKTRELEDEFFLFSLQLRHKPVTIRAFGFFDLGYSYVYQMLCGVGAYVIILIQFYTSQANSSV